MGCQAFRAVSQTIASGATVAVGLDSEIYDPNGFHDNATNNTRITPTEAGKYDVKAQIAWAVNGIGERFCGIRLNGSGVEGGLTIPAAGGSIANFMDASATVDMNGTTDYVELIATQTSTGDLNILGGSVDSASLTLQRIAD